jgi:hypothetical protein
VMPVLANAAQARAYIDERTAAWQAAQLHG